MMTKQERKIYSAAWAKANPESHKAAQKRFRAAHPERCLASGRKWRKENREKVNNYRTKHPEKCFGENARRDFGLTLEQYIEFLSIPCAICGGPSIHLDHCHATGRIRMGLCGLCNKGLGAFKDCPTRLRAAASYLEAFQ